jgi:hypothetical protein
MGGLLGIGFAPTIEEGRMHSSIDDETLERVARAMCQADGKDPDQRHPTGDVETVRAAGGGSSQEDVTIPMWRRYLREARMHIAADQAIKVRT